MALNIGRVCMKIAGREAGRYCVVLKKLDDTFVLVTGPKELTNVRRRRANVRHLEPTNEIIEIGRGSSDVEVMEALKKADKVEKIKVDQADTDV